jgi:mono/diheme cytochrome c family protein
MIHRSMKAGLACGVIGLVLGSGVQAGEDTIELKDGPGREQVQRHCIACHSLDYIQMNSPFLDRKGWEASVGKMIKVMGAHIDESEARAIVDYLAAHYGK